MDEANIIPFSNMFKVLTYFSKENYIFSIYKCKSRVHLNSSNSSQFYFTLSKSYLVNICRFLIIQLKISAIMLTSFRSADMWFFYLGDFQLFPLIISKILKKRTFLILGGFAEKELSQKDKNIYANIYANIFKLVKKANLFLADMVIIYSQRIIESWMLEKYRSKLFIAHEHFIDFELFDYEIKLQKRKNIVAYIGRLSEEKGIINFLGAVDSILRRGEDIEFLVIGDGKLKEEVIGYIEKSNFKNKLKFVQWIPHEELPSYLNKIKLLVLPSYSEGLPNIIIEAMSCGTPVLASKVGAIPDIIFEGTTGFLMENNTPECISINILKIIKTGSLEEISENARKLVLQQFSYVSTIARWEILFENNLQ
jgi:glycosyltransferase involved in cell wall biosynthesis